MKRRLSVFLFVIAAVLAGFMLFSSSQSVQDSEARLRRLKMEIAQEERAIKVLNTEWDYLNRPSRLESLAGNYLGLGAPDVSQMVHIDALPEVEVPEVLSLKPVMKPRPASYRANVADRQRVKITPVKRPLAKPEQKPSASDHAEGTEKQFHNLLQDLGGEGGL